MTDPALHKLESTDAFVVIDLPDAETADGIVRCARKVLVDSTRALARSRTYAWALLDQRISGASAGINATADQRTGALEAFCTEMAPEVAAGRLLLTAGKGIEASELESLGEVPDDDPAAYVAGMTACAATALEAIGDGSSGLDSTTVAVEFDGGFTDALAGALADQGAKVVAHGADALETPADVLVFGSRPGVVDHDLAARLPQRVLVPSGALAFTPRALAVAQRRDLLVLPDFLTTAGALAARAGLDPREALAEKTRAVIAHPSGAVLGACLLAEDFLATWCDERPFGRPIG